MKTPLIYDKVALGDLGALGEVPREHVPRRRSTGSSRTRPQADELPGPHAPLRQPAPQLPRPAAPLRGVVDAPPQRARRARCTGCSRVRHVTQDDAHIFCTREQIEDEIFGCLDYLRFLYDLFGIEPRASSSRRGPTTSSARTRSGTSPRQARARRSSGARSTTSSARGRASFYGPKIDLHVTRRRSAARGRWGRSSSTRRCRAVRAHLHGRRQPSSTRPTSSTARSSARSSASWGS